MNAHRVNAHRVNTISARLRSVTVTALLAASGLAPIALLGNPTANAAPPNLTQNAGFEQVEAGGSATCWQVYGSGNNTYTAETASPGRTGNNAMRLSMTAHTSGDRALRATETASCATPVTAGHTYQVSMWYTADTAAAAVTLFRHDTATGWVYWQDLGPLAAQTAYTQFSATTAVVPANTDLISWGPYLPGQGVLTVDDFSTTDSAPPTTTSPAPTTTTAPPTTTTAPPTTTTAPPTTTTAPPTTTTAPPTTTTAPPTTTTAPPTTTTSAPAGGGANLVRNPGFETAGAGGLPDCWTVYGSGVNTFTAGAVSPGRTGNNALKLEMTARTSGDQSMRMTETTACAPQVVVGHSYQLSLWYTSTTAAAAVTLFRHDTVTGWQYWKDLGPLAVSATYSQFQALSPAVPANTDMISWGGYVHGVNTVTLDDYSMVDTAAPPAPPNLVQNPSLETVAADGFPSCWVPGGSGDNTFTYSLAHPGRTGDNALTIDITAYTGGDRTAKMAETPACAPGVAAGHQYKLAMWYTSTTPNAAVTLYRHDTTTGWQYWQDLGTLPPSATYAEFTALTPVIPAGTDMIVWGGYVYGVGSLTTDDYSTIDTTTDPTTPPPPAASCTGTAVECAKGSWAVLPYNMQVRAIHSVLLRNGKILLVAGSGNDRQRFSAGEFKTAVYDPADGSFIDVPTPIDMFCVGHAQLPDGRVLVMGGTTDYSAADDSHGFLGQNQSYIFDPATNQYTRTNDLNGGHWYPSATALGNGDILSVGGLAESGLNIESTLTEYYSVAQGRWLGATEVTQTNRRWGLYPTLILMQDGRLFSTGSHSLGGNAFDATGAEIYDYEAGTRTDVPGLQAKDEMDHSMSLLLPPAQDQRVITMGGGNTVTNSDANRLTNIIDLKQPNPTYHPGPLLPSGTMADTGAAQTPAQGKMYLNAVILPDGKVFETGGSLHARADDVAEASMYDPVANTFTPMATDPVPRNYHASATLLPDGRVLLITSDPNNGYFELRISVYSPPYLFHGPQPVITELPNANWAYGTTQQLTVDRPIAKAQLIRPAAVTHQSDPNQRSIDLPLTGTGTTVGVNLTPNPNLAPAGWYMLFVTDANGVPSVAKWVKVG